MPTKTKPIADVAKKWVDVTSQRGVYYEAGVKGAGADWEAKAKAASAAFKAGVSAANIEKMFVGGIARAGAAKYERKASGVGKDRFGPGVSAAQDDYNKGESPMLDAIAKVDPPARQPRGNVANRRRSEVYQEALNKLRLALRAAGG